MKSALAITGYLSLSFIILGSLFKIQHWPGGGLMLVLGTLIFSTAFLIIYLIYRIKNKTSSHDMLEGILLSISLWFLSIGLLFKVQHWPGSGIMMIAGFNLIAGLFLPVFLFGFYKNKEKRNSLNILHFLIGVAGIMMVLSINVGKNVLNGYVVNNTTIVSGNKGLTIANASIANKLSQHPEAMLIHQSSQEIFNLIQDYKKHLGSGIAGLPEGLPEESYTLQNLHGKDNYDIPTEILIGSEPINPKSGEWSAIYLRQRLIDYREFLLSKVKSEEAKQNINQILSYDKIKDMSGIDRSWETGLFYHSIAASVYLSLSTLQNGCLTAESIALGSFDAKVHYE